MIDAVSCRRDLSRVPVREGSLAKLRRRTASARQAYRVGGLRAVALKALPVLGYHRIVFFEALLNPPLPPPPAAVPLTFGFLERAELAEMTALGSDDTLAQLEQRLDRGERCLVARSEGRIVSAYWVHRLDVALPEVGHVIVVPADAVYVCDAFTAPALRGQRIAPALSRELKNRIAAEGYERWISYVLGGNDAGLINTLRSGSRETGRLAALKLGPLPPIRVPYLPRRGRGRVI